MNETYLLKQYVEELRTMNVSYEFKDPIQNGGELFV